MWVFFWDRLFPFDPKNEGMLGVLPLRNVRPGADRTLSRGNSKWGRLDLLRSKKVHEENSKSDEKKNGAAKDFHLFSKGGS